MAVWKRAKKRNKLDPVSVQLGIFRCSTCSQPLEVERVVSADVERVDGTATGFILFEHFCACDEGTLLSSRQLGSYPSFVALFGEQPSLPYQAPFEWQGVVEEDDPMIARWQWELEQVADFDDFMRFLNAA